MSRPPVRLLVPALLLVALVATPAFAQVDISNLHGQVVDADGTVSGLTVYDGTFVSLWPASLRNGSMFRGR